MVRCAARNSVSPILTILIGLPGSPESRLLPALFVTIAFGAAALLLRAVSVSGAAAGTLSAFLIYLGLGWGGFVTLAVVFALTVLATRVGYRRKQQLGLAEKESGRDAGQVLANLAAAAAFAVLAPRNNMFAIAAVAALAEAAADTAQSEIGQIASRRAWLITTFRQVAPGTNGGITLPGSLAGAVAVSAVVLVSAAMRVIPANLMWVAASAGFLGTVVDSLLGATLERAGWLNNNAVNFLSTLAGAAIAIALLRASWPV